MDHFYRHVGISRQGFQQGFRGYEAECSLMREIEEKVAIYRSEHDRRAGSRSLYYNLNIKVEFGLGINKFERLMSAYNLTLAPMRVRVVTTQSCLQSWNYANLAEGMEIDDINQLVVGDLTYISMGRYRYYLFGLTDVYSSRLVGYKLHTRMRAIEALAAFEMWIELRGKENVNGCVHHTDGGRQYFSHIYMQAMDAGKLKVSVARNCLQNGYAEQRNGLIKHHLLPTVKSSIGAGLTRGINQIMYFYNHKRKQQALGWRSPVEYEAYIATLENKPSWKIYAQKPKTKDED
jgi:putative transposase